MINLRQHLNAFPQGYSLLRFKMLRVCVRSSRLAQCLMSPFDRDDLRVLISRLNTVNSDLPKKFSHFKKFFIHHITTSSKLLCLIPIWLEGT